MSYLVLARKYRPHQFQEMVGQTHVLRALTNALEQQRLHHAYLFTGTRGVGKTTVARIFAKSLSCERGVSANPCGECATCQEIDTGRYIDLLEIDAASRTKVEDTRELLDNIQYSPQRGRYKIYYIDEVHMLSSHSFNALLKTLEEPPPHVKFLLATTDPQKLPVTVLSRCLQFHLKNMSPEQIVLQLSAILTKENIPFEQNALNLIAKAAQGSMRDALSLLDQCIAYGAGDIKQDDIIHMLGLVHEQQIIELLRLIIEHNIQGVLAKIDELAELGADFFAVLDELLELLQKMAVTKLLGDPLLALQCTDENIQLYYQIALLGKRDLPLAPDPKSGFTMIMIRILAFTPAESKPVITPKTAKNPEPATPPSVAVTEAKNWPNILAKLSLTGLAQLLASHCVLVKYDHESMDLSLDESQAALLNPASKERLIKALEQYVGKPCKINLTIGKSSLATPAKQQQQQQEAKRQTAQENLLRDPQVQVMMEKFSATLQTDSLDVAGY